MEKSHGSNTDCFMKNIHAFVKRIMKQHGIFYVKISCVWQDNKEIHAFWKMNSVE